MGLYSRLIFPRLCDWAMRAPHIARLRRDVLAGANGEILEIGFGTGLNLADWMWISRLWSDRGRSGKSKSSGSCWKGLRGSSARCTGAWLRSEGPVPSTVLKRARAFRFGDRPLDSLSNPHRANREHVQRRPIPDHRRVLQPFDQVPSYLETGGRHEASQSPDK